MQAALPALQQKVLELGFSAQWSVSEAASSAPLMLIRPADSQDLVLCGHFVGEFSMTLRGPALFPGCTWTHLLTLSDHGALGSPLYW